MQKYNRLEKDANSLSEHLKFLEKDELTHLNILAEHIEDTKKAYDNVARFIAEQYVSIIHLIMLLKLIEFIKAKAKKGDQEMKQQSFKLTGTTKQEYEAWCVETGNPAYKKESKEKFFNLVINKKLVRDKITGKLIRKHLRKK